MALSNAIAPSGEQFELVHGEQRAVVVEVGGGLRSYRRGNVDLLDGFAAADRSDGGRGQVLAPWPNRLGDGRYEWEGETHQLPLSEPELANAIHGLVRWRNWQVLDRAPSRLTVGLRLLPLPGYPFALGLSVEYELGEEGLAVCARAENLGDSACPYGIGFHPYLKIGATVDTAALEVPAARVLTADERQLPVASEPVAGTSFDFRKPRAIGAQVLDTCFTDLIRDGDGVARVTLADEDRTVTLWMAEPFAYVMVYSGDTLAAARRRRGLAIEPMTCAPDAFRTGEGLVRLDPHERHEARWGIAS